MKDRKGFTLVELLAVIVILAIIMIIAIPSVLNTLEIARKKTFIEYVTKVYETGLNKYLEQITTGTLPSNECIDDYTGPCYINSYGLGNIPVYFYEVQTSLGLSSTGSYEGFVAIVPIAQGRTEPEVFVGLYDDNYIVRTRIPKNDGTHDTEPKYLFNYTRYGDPSVYDVTVVADSKINACNGYYKKTEVNHGLWGINTLLEDKVSMEK